LLHSLSDTDQIPLNAASDRDQLAPEGAAGDEQAFWFAGSEDFRQVALGLPASTRNTGLILFDRFQYDRNRFKAISALVNLPETTCYKVFESHSPAPVDDGYLTQWRFATRLALESYFHVAPSSCDCERTEDLVMGMVAYIEHEIVKYHDPQILRHHIRQPNKAHLSYGLGFSLLVENSHLGIYRLWSRIVLYSQ
jgi:hypothetical protein